MSEEPEPAPRPRTDPYSLRDELAELVRRSLIELGEMSQIQERIKEISERISKVTPLPDPPGEIKGEE